jgi:predicted phage-related endonuclease
MGSTPTGISGSRAAAILGMSDWSTSVEAWLKIMEEREPGFCKGNGYITPERKDSAPFRWGLAFEDAVTDLAMRARHESQIHSMEKEYRFNNYITCHVDGIYASGIIHEGKTTNIRSFRNKWGEPGSNRVPQEYQIQVQHQMLCAGIDKAIISVLVFPKMVDEWEKEGYSIDRDGVHLMTDYTIFKNNTAFGSPQEWAIALESMGYFHQYEIESNKPLQELMLDICLEWWKKHVIGRTPPEPKVYSDIKKLVIAPKGTIVVGDLTYRLSQEYKQLTSEIGRLEKRKDQIKTRILTYMKEKADVPIDDDSLEKWILKDTEGRKLHSFNGKTFR